MFSGIENAARDSGSAIVLCPRGNILVVQLWMVVHVILRLRGRER
ncbi:MAG: hypothetical protein ACI9WU_003994 [Myxococcota bacterium]|jgi:hypothetical protein